LPDLALQAHALGLAVVHTVLPHYRLDQALERLVLRNGIFGLFHLACSPSPPLSTLPASLSALPVFPSSSPTAPPLSTLPASLSALPFFPSSSPTAPPHSTASHLGAGRCACRTRPPEAGLDPSRPRPGQRSRLRRSCFAPDRQHNILQRYFILLLRSKT
jgi:hypothetical protein